MSAYAPLTLTRADTWRARLKGLLGVRHLPAGQARWLMPCRAVHTVGMRIAIDLAFLDAHGRVIRLVSRLAPGRLAICWRAASVVELAAGSLSAPGARAWVEQSVARALAENGGKKLGRKR